jgi:protein-S-isoprenylcysteine O-methyltransferase Ste14
MLHLIELRAPAIYLRFVHHPGYLAMCISAIASAIAIGSYLALIPALAFVFVIHRRARLEDSFLKLNLAGVSAGLPFIRSS